MAKFKVLVAVTYHREFTITADDEEHAISKALVRSQENGGIADAQVIGIEEGE